MKKFFSICLLVLIINTLNISAITKEEAIAYQIERLDKIDKPGLYKIRISYQKDGVNLSDTILLNIKGKSKATSSQIDKTYLKNKLFKTFEKKAMVEDHTIFEFKYTFAFALIILILLSILIYSLKKQFTNTNNLVKSVIRIFFT